MCLGSEQGTVRRVGVKSLDGAWSFGCRPISDLAQVLSDLNSARPEDAVGWPVGRVVCDLAEEWKVLLWCALLTKPRDLDEQVCR